MNPLRRAFAMVVLGVGTCVGYLATTFEYEIRLNERVSLLNATRGKLALVVREGTCFAGLTGLGDVREYAVCGGYVVGTSAEGWFIVDEVGSRRLVDLGLADETSEPWVPAHACFSKDEKREWLAALRLLGIETPVTLLKPSKWDAEIQAPTYIAWGIVVAIWVAWYLRGAKIIRHAPRQSG